MGTFLTRFAASGATRPGASRVAVKDLIDLAGVPTTSGSRVLAAAAGPAFADAACLAGTRAAEEAGEVVLVGKTNLHELAFGVTGVNPWYGTPVNPIDPGRVPGGSSSGSAVAVATGEADIAFGTDTGGSIRVPAACCGVVGLKTTRGRVPLCGVAPLAPSLDTVGPMAATVALTAAGMALLEPGFSASRAPARRVARMRLPCDPHIDDALDSALEAAGLDVEEVEPAGWAEATTATMTILMAEAWSVHSGTWRQHAGDLSPDVSARLEAASLVGAEEVAQCWERLRDWSARLASLWTRFELVALPTLSGDPPTLVDAQRLTSMRHVAPFNGAGTPALAMPVATAGPFPASLQLSGPAGSEGLLLATARAVEEAAGSTRPR